jgi:hypothetical protein
MNNKCVVLFSGGTDSFCSAALACENHEEVHLLTFFEEGTKSSPIPTDNILKLRTHYPLVQIFHQTICTDRVLKILCYESYFKNLFKYKFLNLATPGHSSLSWHCESIRYAIQNNIVTVYDGMTRELLHLPGHMPEVREIFTRLYQKFNIRFSSPVVQWDVPPDQRFVDKLIVDQHGFTFKSSDHLRTTGTWLYEKGLLPHPNVKGSLFDRLMQHDCYPFVIYNMLVFWIYEPLFGYEKFKLKLSKYFENRTALAERILRHEIN